MSVDQRNPSLRLHSTRSRRASSTPTPSFTAAQDEEKPSTEHSPQPQPSSDPASPPSPQPMIPAVTAKSSPTPVQASDKPDAEEEYHLQPQPHSFEQLRKQQNQDIHRQQHQQQQRQNIMKKAKIESHPNSEPQELQQSNPSDICAGADMEIANDTEFANQQSNAATATAIAAKNVSGESNLSALPPSKASFAQSTSRKVSVGEYIDIWWTNDDAFYRARVVGMCPNIPDVYRVLYDDGDHEDINLMSEVWKFSSSQSLVDVASGAQQHTSTMDNPIGDAQPQSQHAPKPPKKAATANHSKYNQQVKFNQSRRLKGKDGSSASHSGKVGGQSLSPAIAASIRAATAAANEAIAYAASSPVPASASNNKPRVRRKRRSSANAAASETNDHDTLNGSAEEPQQHQSDQPNNDIDEKTKTGSDSKSGSPIRTTNAQQQEQQHSSLSSSPSSNLRRNRRASRRAMISTGQERRAYNSKNHSNANKSTRPSSSKRQTGNKSRNVVGETGPVDRDQNSRPGERTAIANGKKGSTDGFVLHIPPSSAPDLSGSENHDGENGEKGACRPDIDSEATRQNFDKGQGDNNDSCATGVNAAADGQDVTMDDPNMNAGSTAAVNIVNESVDENVNVNADSSKVDGDGDVNMGKVATTIEVGAERKTKKELSLPRRLFMKKLAMKRRSSKSASAADNQVPNPSILTNGGALENSAAAIRPDPSRVEGNTESPISRKPQKVTNARNNPESSQPAIPPRTRASMSRVVAKREAENESGSPAPNGMNTTGSTNLPVVFQSIPLHLQLKEDSYRRAARMGTVSNGRARLGETAPRLGSGAGSHNGGVAIAVTGGNVSRSSAMAAAATAAAATRFARRLADGSLKKHELSEVDGEEEAMLLGKEEDVRHDDDDIAMKNSNGVANREQLVESKQNDDDLKSGRRENESTAIERGPPRKRVRVTKSDAKSPASASKQRNVASPKSRVATKVTSNNDGALKTRSNPTRARTLKLRSIKVTKTGNDVPNTADAARATVKQTTTDMNGTTAEDERLSNMNGTNNGKQAVDATGINGGDEQDKEDSGTTDFEPVVGENADPEQQHQVEESPTGHTSIIEIAVTQPRVLEQVSKGGFKRTQPQQSKQAEEQNPGTNASDNNKVKKRKPMNDGGTMITRQQQQKQTDAEKKANFVKLLQAVESLINQRLSPLSSRLDKLSDQVDKIHTEVAHVKHALSEGDKRGVEQGQMLQAAIKKISSRVSDDIKGIHSEVNRMKNDTMTSNRNVLQSVSLLRDTVEPSVKVWIQESVDMTFKKMQTLYEKAPVDNNDENANNHAKTGAGDNDGTAQTNAQGNLPQHHVRTKLNRLSRATAAASIANGSDGMLNPSTQPNHGAGAMMTSGTNNTPMYQTVMKRNINALQAASNLMSNASKHVSSRLPMNTVPLGSANAPMGSSSNLLAVENVNATVGPSALHANSVGSSSSLKPDDVAMRDVGPRASFALSSVNVGPGGGMSGSTRSNNVNIPSPVGIQFGLYRPNCGFTTRVTNLVARQVTVCLLETPHEKSRNDMDVASWSKKTTNMVYSLVHQKLQAFTSYAQAYHELSSKLGGEDSVELFWFIRPWSSALLYNARRNYVAWEPPISDAEWEEEMVLLKEVAEGYHRATDQFFIVTGMTELQVAIALTALVAELYCHDPTSSAARIREVGKVEQDSREQDGEENVTRNAQQEALGVE